MAVHQSGMMEPMMVIDIGVDSVGINYSTNRPPFPPPQAHTGVPNTISNHLPAPVQTIQNPPNAAIVPQLQLQQSQQQQLPPPGPIQPSAPSSADNIDKPKKPRKKRPSEGTGVNKSESEVKIKKKKTASKDKPKTKQKKSSDGTVSLLGKKGKTLDAQAREIALNVAEYFKREADLGQTLMPLHSYQKRAAAATGVSTATLRKLEGARREIKSERVAAEKMVENPFPDLHIDDTSFLDTIESRHKCKRCTKSRKFFCYSCCSPSPQIQDKLPKIKLPLKIDIIKHQSESDGKSTCPHAVVLAPEDVTVHKFPKIPKYDKKKVVLVVPCKEAITLKDLAMGCTCAAVVSTSNTPAPEPDNTMGNTTTTDSGLHTPRPDQLHSVTGYTDITTSSTYADLQTIWTTTYFPQPGPSANIQSNETYTFVQPLHMYPTQDYNHSGKKMNDAEDPNQERKPIRVITPPFERAVFIDSSWNQTKNIIQDERLKDLRRVELQGHETQFWRCQEGLPTSCLSTIEAIYYFLREYQEDVLDSTYLNEYDNLLFFFVYFYRKIREKYQGGKDLKSCQKKITDHDGQEGLM